MGNENIWKPQNSLNLIWLHELVPFNKSLRKFKSIMYLTSWTYRSSMNFCWSALDLVDLCRTHICALLKNDISAELANLTSPMSEGGLVQSMIMSVTVQHCLISRLREAMVSRSWQDSTSKQSCSSQRRSRHSRAFQVPTWQVYWHPNDQSKHTLHVHSQVREALCYEIWGRNNRKLIICNINVMYLLISKLSWIFHASEKYRCNSLPNLILSGNISIIIINNNDSLLEHQPLCISYD